MAEASVEIWDDDILAGAAWLHPSRDGMAVEFTYDRDFLASPRVRQIDPEFGLYDGTHVANTTPGCLADATPDAWGKFLIRSALRSAGKPREADAVDYLLNVSDAARQGSLRFRVDGQFVRADQRIPHHLELGQLAHLAREAERTGDPRLVRELFDSGAEATGGAVPKATVEFDDGSLWIAKFYSGDTGRWEKVAFDLAERAGLDVPEARLIEASEGAVFLSRRFDRDGARRVPYLSAASLLGHDSRQSADYADIADAVRDHGAAPIADLQQLWRRMAFQVAVNSTDDHLRNHGFVWQGHSWTLSKMFDVVPSDSLERKTSINGHLDRGSRVEALVECSDYFEVRNPGAELGRIWGATDGWRSVARDCGLTRTEIDRKAAAFEYLRGKVEQVAAG